MPSAGRTRSTMSANRGRGIANPGRPLGMSPRVATPWAARSAAEETTMATTTDDQRTGQPRGQAPQRERATRATRPVARVVTESSSRPARRSTTWPIGGPPRWHPGQLGQLAADQDDRHPVDEADHRHTGRGSPRPSPTAPCGPGRTRHRRAGPAPPPARRTAPGRPPPTGRRRWRPAPRRCPRDRRRAASTSRAGRRPRPGAGGQWRRRAEGRRPPRSRWPRGSQGRRRSGRRRRPAGSLPLVALELSGHRHGPVQQARAGPGHEG